MKIIAEIKDNRFHFDYEIGSSRHAGNSEISPELLVVFANFLSQVSDASRIKNESTMKRYNAMAWVEKNPEEAKKIIEKIQEPK